MATAISTLRDQAAEAVERGKLDKALAIYAELEDREPTSPTWPKRRAETHRRAGDLPAAVAAFTRAARCYAATGFLVQAIAVCKLILQLDPAHADARALLAELAPAASRRRTPPATPAPAPAPALELELAPEPARPRGRLPERGGSLDSIELAALVPGAQRVTRDDGSDAGISIISIELDLEELAGSGSIEIDLDDAVDVPDRAAARRALASTPLFSQVAPTALAELFERMPLIELPPGAQVFREGDPGTSLYVIADGEVAVTAGGAELARIGPGAFFGEIALVTDLPRSATIQAITGVELLAIDRDVVREAAAAHPELVTVLLRFVRDRLIDRVARTSELFRPFSEGERAGLAARFELLEVVPGAPLIVEGGRADGLYVVMAGRLEVRRASAGTIATLGTGDVFGEQSLLGGGGATATVVPVTRVLALRLPAPSFREVIMTHPQVLAYVSELAARRAEASDDVVDFRLDLRV